MAEKFVKLKKLSKRDQLMIKKLSKRDRFLIYGLMKLLLRWEFWEGIEELRKEMAQEARAKNAEAPGL